MVTITVDLETLYMIATVIMAGLMIWDHIHRK